MKRFKYIDINSERWMNPCNLSRKEIWKGLPFLPCEYSVSNFGRVRKKDKRGKYKILYSVDNGRKYYAVSIKHKKYYIHRLVAFAFVPNPQKYPEIDHIDGTKYNNVAENLRWVTRRMNMLNPITLERREAYYERMRKNYKLSPLFKERVISQ